MVHVLSTLIHRSKFELAEIRKKSRSLALLLILSLHQTYRQHKTLLWVGSCLNLLSCVALYRLCRPFSSDYKFVLSIPPLVCRTIYRRILYGPLYPEWSFPMEIVQCIMKTIAMDYGDRLVYPTRHIELARANVNFLSIPLALLWIQRLGYQRESLVIHHTTGEKHHQVTQSTSCEWLKPQRSCHYQSPTSSTSTKQHPFILFYLHGGESFESYLSIHPFIFIHPFIYSHIHPSIHPLIYSNYSPIHLFTYSSINKFTYVGGYACMSPITHFEMVIRIMEQMKRESSEIPDIHAFFVDYRKAPEHVFPAAVEDAMAGYQYLIEHCGIDPSRIIFAGDSAGGGLVLSLLLALKRKQTPALPLPAATICLSPFVDLKTDDPDVEHDMISQIQVQTVRSIYLPPDGQDWAEASPVHNDLSGLPPLLIQVGSQELLYRSCLRLAMRATADGVETVLDVHPNMPHVFTYFPSGLCSQSTVGIAKIAKFAAFHFLKTNDDAPRSRENHTTTTTMLKDESPVVDLRRNVSSLQLGEKDCFLQPHYMNHSHHLTREDSTNMRQLKRSISHTHVKWCG